MQKAKPRLRRRTRRRVSGVTILELLVTISLVGLLLQLLFPAVLAARESARRLQCTANLRSIGQAMSAHVTTHDRFPSGGWHFDWVGEPERGTDRHQPGSWVFNLLAYLDEEPLRCAGRELPTLSREAMIRARCATPLRALICPSRRSCSAYPQTQNHFGKTASGRMLRPLVRAAKSDYAACVGDQAQVEFDWKWKGPTDLSAGDDPRFAWPDTHQFRGVVFGRSQVTPRQVADGMSHTYFAGEKYMDAAKYTTGDDWGDNENLYSGFNNDVCRSALVAARPDARGQEQLLAFGSAHATVWQCCFCDGSVRAIDYDLDLDLHRQWARRDDSRRSELIIRGTSP